MCKQCQNYCKDETDETGATTKFAISAKCPDGSVEDTHICSVACPDRDTDTFLIEGMEMLHGALPKKSITEGKGDICVLCSMGEYEVGGTCHTCPSGYYGTRGGTSCEACEAGFFQSKTGQSECMECGSGQYQKQIGQTGCIACEVGKAREAFFPNSNAIMKRQGVLQDCLVCGSMYNRGEVYEPGCEFCNQYQDEAGQQTCKRCPMDPSELWQYYSYLDSNGVAYTKEGSCKYAENLQYWWVRKRVVDPRPDGQGWGGLEWCGPEYPDQPFSSDAQKRLFMNWTACVYASSTWTGKRYDEYSVMTYDDWFGDFNFYKDEYTLQGYNPDCPELDRYMDYYTTYYLGVQCETTVAELQHGVFRL